MASLNITTLDFDEIKQNLKTYLQSQDIFKDYDFDGSNISVLLDLLAYNTSMQSFYVNMLASESFLDSAQLRSSVISHAKELNYIPRSSRSSKATIQLTAEQNNSDTLVIPKGTTFTTTYNSKTYTFSTDEIKTYYAEYDEDSETYSFTTGNIDIYEGFYIDESFTMNYSVEDQRFILSNENIDTTSLVINSVEDSGSSIINYTYSETLLGLTSASRKYFLQATEDGKYEILFGDDIIGRRPPNGSIITVQYRLSSGTTPNGASRFSCDTDLTSDLSGRISVTTITKAAGGSIAETIRSIKFNAPRHFQSQERAITASDYETLLKARFPEINSVSVYGGEEASPPQYGKVFIAINLSDIDIIPDSKRSEYETFLKPKMANPIQPVFVNSSYVYAKVISEVKYNLNVTNIKPDEIKLMVENKINAFNAANLNDFNTTLYSSKLIKDIDASHTSVVSNITDIYVYKKITPTINLSQNIDINYNIALRDDIPEIAPYHHISELRTVYSSQFTYDGESAIFEDDGIGNIRMMRASGGSLTLIKTIGTVDYDNGLIQLTNFNIQSFDGESIRVYALPKSRDIKGSKNDILRIEPVETSVTIKTVRV